MGRDTSPAPGMPDDMWIGTEDLYAAIVAHARDGLSRVYRDPALRHPVVAALMLVASGALSLPHIMEATEENAQVGAMAGYRDRLLDIVAEALGLPRSSVPDVFRKAFDGTDEGGPS